VLPVRVSLDLDPGIFKFLKGFFIKLWLKSWKKLILIIGCFVVHENFTGDISLDGEVPFKFLKSSGCRLRLSMHAFYSWLA